MRKNACRRESFLGHEIIYLMKVLFNTSRSSGVLEDTMDVTVILLKPEFQESEKGNSK